MTPSVRIWTLPWTSRKMWKSISILQKKKLDEITSWHIQIFNARPDFCLRVEWYSRPSFPTTFPRQTEHGALASITVSQLLLSSLLQSQAMPGIALHCNHHTLCYPPQARIVCHHNKTICSINSALSHSQLEVRSDSQLAIITKNETTWNIVVVLFFVTGTFTVSLEP